MRGSRGTTTTHGKQRVPSNVKASTLLAERLPWLTEEGVRRPPPMRRDAVCKAEQTHKTK